MILKTKLFGKVYEFKSLREVMAKANEEKSGDKLAGIAAESAEERVAAKVVLSHITLEDLRNNPAVPYEEDEVTRIIQDGVNEAIYKDNDGRVRVTGLYSEKTGKTYDAAVVLEDDGQYANFKLEFDQRKGGSR